MNLRFEDVKGVALIGLGTMGEGWVAQLLEGGFRVFGYDEEAEQRSSARERVLKHLGWIEKKRMKKDEDGILQRVHGDGFAAEVIERFTVVNTLDELIAIHADFQIVLECVYEDLKLKQDLFVTLAEGFQNAMGDDWMERLILWSNTSSLDVLAMGRPAGVTKILDCTHGMNPVPRMGGVEHVRTVEVDDGIFTLTTDLLTKKLGKVAFEAPNVPGFWINNLGIPFWDDAIRILERGEITVKDGDIGLKLSVGHPQGTFKLMDFIGLDVMYKVTMAMYLATRDPRHYPPALLMRLVKAGEVGIKSKAKKGFYDWSGDKPVPRDFSEYVIYSSETKDMPI